MKDVHKLSGNLTGEKLFMQTKSQENKGHGPDPSHSLLLLIRFYWNRATAIHLYNILGCFCTAVVRLSSDDGDPVGHKV